MIDTDITLPPNYLTLDLARSRHDPYLPSAPTTPQTLVRVGVVRPPEIPSGCICSLLQRVLDYFNLGVETPRLKGQGFRV